MPWRAVVSLSLVLLFAGCGTDPEDLADRATRIFQECLERNGVVATELRVTVSDDRLVEAVAAQIVEGQSLYEPAVRLACIEEVETNLTQ
jgi:hypothetical protein